jgi:hypothetical protein
MRTTQKNRRRRRAKPRKYRSAAIVKYVLHVCGYRVPTNFKFTYVHSLMRQSQNQTPLTIRLLFDTPSILVR